MFTETGIANNFRPRIQASSISLHFQKKIAPKALQPLVEKLLIDYEFLIFHNVIFSGITALTAFNRNDKGVTAVLVGIKALTAFC